MAEILNSLPRAILLQYNKADDRKLLDLLENKKVDIFPDGDMIEIHFQKKEERKAFEDFFPKVPKRR